MVIIHDHIGCIEFRKTFFESLVTSTVRSCFGVSAMNAYGAAEIIGDKIPLFRELFDINKGVNIIIKDGKVNIGIHISVMYGINIPAVVSSIKNKLSYTVEEQTGLPVEKIDVYIDGLTT